MTFKEVQKVMNKLGYIEENLNGDYLYHYEKNDMDIPYLAIKLTKNSKKENILYISYFVKIFGRLIITDIRNDADMGFKVSKLNKSKFEETIQEQKNIYNEYKLQKKMKEIEKKKEEIIKDFK